MKRIIAFILSIMLVLSSCADEKTQITDTPDTVPPAETVEATEPTLPPPLLTGDEDTFSLSYLPDIGEYEPEEAPERWYADYVGELIPSEDYGELIPYLGYEKRFAGEGDHSDAVYYSRYYGLCTLGGVIVTDPVYSYITQGEDGYYILRGIPKTEDRGHYSEIVYPYYVAKSDGSSLVKLSDGATECGYLANGLYYATWDPYNISLYDREGGLVRGATSEKFGYYYTPRVYSDGVMVQEHHMKAYFMNYDLERISDVYKEIWPCGDGYYRVEALGSSEYGLVDGEGNFAMPLEYEYLDDCDAGYLTAKDGTFALLDLDFNEVFSFEYEGEIFFARSEGPSVITVSIEGEEFEQRAYTVSGERLSWKGVSYIDSKEMYFLTTDSETVITDINFNEIVRFPEVYAYRYIEAEERYLCMSVQKIKSDGTADFDLYDLVLYDMKNRTVIDSVYEAKADHYIKRTDNGEFVYYSYDGEKIDPPYADITYDNKLSKERRTTPCGELYFYMDGDYACTEDSEGNIIVKRRTEFD